MRCVVTPLFIYDNTAAELLVFSQLSHCWTSSSQAKWSRHCAQIISSFCVFSAFSSEVPHTFLSGYRWLLISPGWSVSLQEYTTHYCNRIICICYSVNIQTWAFLKKNQNTGLKWSIKECKGFVLLYALIIIISDHISSMCFTMCVFVCAATASSTRWTPLAHCVRSRARGRWPTWTKASSTLWHSTSSVPTNAFATPSAKSGLACYFLHFIFHLAYLFPLLLRVPS